MRRWVDSSTVSVIHVSQCLRHGGRNSIVQTMVVPTDLFEKTQFIFYLYFKELGSYPGFLGEKIISNSKFTLKRFNFF